MKHIYSFLPLFVAACTTSVVCAQDYNKDEVQQMASTFLGNGISTFSNDAAPLTIDSLFLSDNPKMFLCQNGTNWVVLANEQLVRPIVCHGEGTITLDELYESPLWFLLTESMIGLDSIRILGDEANPEGFATDNGIATFASGTAMTPLLEKNGRINKWGQSQNNDYTSDISKSYNKLCPAFYNVSNGRTIVGCTAVAIGQILWYWKFPSSARIPVSIDIAGITSYDFETHYYDWNNMPGRLYNNTPQKQIDNVAGLLRDCGYSGNMIYGAEGSSMTITNALYALRNDFNYSAHMKQYSSGAKKFNNIIKSEIAAGRPVMIQATHSTNVKEYGTHTFIIDGYDSKAEEYHLNLGWKGNYDSWYSVSGTNSYFNYRVARRMLYEIIPNNTKQIVAPQNYDIEENENDIITIGRNHITFSVSDVEQWAIYNNYGYLILEGNETSINIDNLSNGLYVIRIQIAGSIKSKTFLKR